jgi:hypothetical protein
MGGDDSGSHHSAGYDGGGGRQRESSPLPPSSSRLHSYMSMLKAMRGVDPPPTTPATSHQHQRGESHSVSRYSRRSGGGAFDDIDGMSRIGGHRADNHPSFMSPAVGGDASRSASPRVGGDASSSSLGLLAQKLRTMADEEAAKRDAARGSHSRGAHIDAHYDAVRQRLGADESSQRATGGPQGRMSGANATYTPNESTRVVAAHGFEQSQQQQQQRAAVPTSTVLLARVTVPFLVKEGDDLVDAPSFVVQVADMAQSGPDLLSYLIHQARIRFPVSWQACGRSGALLASAAASASMKQSRGYGDPTHGCALYCAGPADVEPEQSGSSSSPVAAPPPGALLMLPYVPLSEYKTVRMGLDANTGDSVAAAMRRTLLAARTLQPMTASSGPVNPVHGQTAELAGHLFDLELFIFDRTSMPPADLEEPALRRGLVA